MTQQNTTARAVQIDKLIAALPAAVDESMQTAIPHLYTPELAAKFTAAMIAELRASHAQRTAVTA